MLRGSIIDSEYKGISTIEVMNLLTPDVATLGNHEIDYGLAHLLFIEKCANFPIINANMYLNCNGTRMFTPYYITRIDGIKIMFIGVLTEAVLTSAKQEELIGTMIDVRDAADEIRKVVDAYKTFDVDLTILLAEGMRSQLDVDLALIGSGSIRGESLGPIVTLQDLMEVYPYANPVIGFRWTGEQLRRAVAFLMRDEALIQDNHIENYQFSKGFFCEYDCHTHSIIRLTMNGKEVRDDDVFLIATERYYYNCMEESLDISHEEAKKNGPPVQLAASAVNVLEEYMSSQDFIKLDGERRFLIHFDTP